MGWIEEDRLKGENRSIMTDPILQTVMIGYMYHPPYWICRSNMLSLFTIDYTITCMNADLELLR